MDWLGLNLLTAVRRVEVSSSKRIQQRRFWRQSLACWVPSLPLPSSLSPTTADPHHVTVSYLLAVLLAGGLAFYYCVHYFILVIEIGLGGFSVLSLSSKVPSYHPTLRSVAREDQTRLASLDRNPLAIEHASRNTEHRVKYLWIDQLCIKQTFVG